jgi:hypothetical protein
MSHDGLEWIVKYGADEDGVPLLVGRGRCPAAAITDFDSKWLGIDE